MFIYNRGKEYHPSPTHKKHILHILQPIFVCDVRVYLYMYSYVCAREYQNGTLSPDIQE